MGYKVFELINGIILYITASFFIKVLAVSNLFEN